MSLPYPNGLVGQPWTPAASGWPGVDGVSGDRNYLPVNTYPVDPQTQPAIDSRAPPADIVGHKGGSRRTRKHSRKTSNVSSRKRKHRHTKGRRHRRSRFRGRSRSKGSRGGGIVNDFIEPIGYHAHSVYTTLNGVVAPVDPRPFVDQLVANPAAI